MSKAFQTALIPRDSPLKKSDITRSKTDIIFSVPNQQRVRGVKLNVGSNNSMDTSPSYSVN